MSIKATTTAPNEVRRLFNEYADILEMYADDQRAMMTRFKVGNSLRRVHAELYEQIAKEMREIEFTCDITKGIDERIEEMTR